MWEVLTLDEEGRPFLDRWGKGGPFDGGRQVRAREGVLMGTGRWGKGGPLRRGPGTLGRAVPLDRYFGCLGSSVLRGNLLNARACAGCLLSVSRPAGGWMLLAAPARGSRCPPATQAVGAHLLRPPPACLPACPQA